MQFSQLWQHVDCVIFQLVYNKKSNFKYYVHYDYYNITVSFI